MTFRVINFTTGEIAAELHDYDTAEQLARQLAEEGQHKEVWAVIELVTRYETPLKGT